MNRLLADAVVALNQLGALIIIVVCLLAGYGIASRSGSPGGVGLFIGGFVGIFVAGFFCGIVALLALIESHLRVLAERTRKNTQTTAASAPARASVTTSRDAGPNSDPWGINKGRTTKSSAG